MIVFMYVCFGFQFCFDSQQPSLFVSSAIVEPCSRPRNLARQAPANVGDTIYINTPEAGFWGVLIEFQH